MSKAFETAASRVNNDPIEFTLDGEEFHFKPPRNMALLALANTGYFEESPLKIQLDWLGAGLAEDEVDRIKARLRDPDADQILITLLEVINYLVEEMAGRPTTPSSD